MGAFSEKGTPMALTDISIKNAKPRERDFKLADGGGLYLLVTVSGGVPRQHQWHRFDVVI